MSNKMTVKQLRIVLNGLTNECDDYVVVFNQHDGTILGNLADTSVDTHSDCLDLFLPPVASNG